MNNYWFKKFFIEEFSESYSSGVFSDELDKLGYNKQVINNWKINNSKNRLFGRVRTLTLETVKTSNEEIGKGLGFLSSLDSGDILVVSGSNEYAYFGELMTRISIQNNLGGTIIDGLTRDTYYTQDSQYPVFAKNYSPVDIKGRGRVNELDVTIEIDGVSICCGDYVYGDSDAVVVIPQGILHKEHGKFNEVVKQEEDIKRMINDNKSITEILQITKEF